MERRVFPHLKEHSKVPPEENTVQKQHNTESLVQEGLGYWIHSSEKEFLHRCPERLAEKEPFLSDRTPNCRFIIVEGRKKMPQLPGWG